MGKPTIYTIAREAGVSTATVSKILNHQGKISPETAQRVMEIIRRHNYVPQQRKQHGNAIGAVTFLSNNRPLASSFVATLLNGVCREAFAHGRDITLIDGNRISRLSPEELHCFYTANSLSGLLGINLSNSEPFYRKLRASQLPYVLLSNAESGGNSVSTKNYESVAEMIDYILCRGHERVAFLGMVIDMFESHIQRLRAYEDTLARTEFRCARSSWLTCPTASGRRSRTRFHGCWRGRSRRPLSFTRAKILRWCRFSNSLA